MAASISPFSHRRYKFSCFSSKEIGLLSFLSLALAIYVSVIHVNVDIKISRKKESVLLLLFLSQKVREGMRLTAETPGP